MAGAERWRLAPESTLRRPGHVREGSDPKALKAAGIVPDLRKRSELYRLNDVELYDVQADPHETKNLAVAGGKARELAAAMTPAGR